MQLPWLNETELRERLRMADAIEAMRSAFTQLSSGRAKIPVRTGVEGDGTLGLFMPGWLPDESALGTKIVTVRPENVGTEVPVVQALVLLIDVATGRPEALLDGTWLTALRTGAGSGLATDLLARADSEVLSLVGAGAQAVTQVEAVLTVRPIRQVRVRSRRRTSAERFVREARDRWASSFPDVEFTVVTDPDAHLAGADIVSTATDSTEAVVPEGVEAGTHINAVGAYTPAMRELPASVLGRARIVVDQRAAAWAEAGDLIRAAEEGHLEFGAELEEIGEIAAGTRPGRRSPEEITVFKSVGSAAQDLAVARRALAGG